MRLIINADDLGASTLQNERIDRYAGDRLITSASLIPNGGTFSQAADVARKHRHISIGAHLTLTEFGSLTGSAVLTERGIVGSDGRFTGLARQTAPPRCGGSNTVRRIRFDHALREAVYDEWAAQIQRLIESGIRVSHLDSHNHVHHRFGLLPVIKRLQRTFGISSVRAASRKPLLFYGVFNPSLPKKTPPLMKEVRNALWNCLLRIQAPNAKTPDYVFSYWSLVKYLQAGCSVPRKGTWEVFVHPGSTYREYFDEENRMVEANELGGWMSSCELITYGEL